MGKSFFSARRTFRFEDENVDELHGLGLELAMEFLQLS